MVNQNWYYMKNSVQHGPVSPKELKALADAGEIIGTDLVRTESMEKWTKASSVKGLIRLAATVTPPSSTVGPPPIPASSSSPVKETERDFRRTIGQRLLAAIGSIVRTTKAAGVAAARQAELARITNIDLPKAFAKLGDEIRHTNQFRSEVSEIHLRIDALEQKLRENQDAAKQKEEKDGMKGAASTIARMTRLKAEEASLRLQRSKLLKELGAIAYEHHKEKAGSQDITSEIASLQNRHKQLRDGVSISNSSTRKSIFNPKSRVFKIVAVSSLVLLLATVAVWHQSGRSLIGESQIGEATSNGSVLSEDKKLIISKPVLSVSDVMGTDFEFSGDGKFLIAMIKERSQQGKELTLPKIFDLKGRKPISTNITWDDAIKLAVGTETLGKAGLDLAAAVNLNAEFNRSKSVPSLKSIIKGHPTRNRLSPYGPMLISTPDDADLTTPEDGQTLVLINVQETAKQRVLKDPKNPLDYLLLGDVVFSYDNKWAAIDRTSRNLECSIWNLESGQLALKLDGYGFRLHEFDHKSKFFALGKTDEGEKLEIIELSSMKQVCVVDHPFGTSFAGFTADGESFAVAGHGDLQPLVLIRKTRSGTLSNSYSVANLRKAFMRGNSDLLLWIEKPDRLQWGSTKDDSIIAEVRFSSVSSEVVYCKVDPTGKYAATVHEDKSIHVWDLTEIQSR